MQCVTGEAEQGPIVQWDGAQAFVEIDGWLVPIENCPLEAAAAALDGQDLPLVGHTFEVVPAAVVEDDA